MVSRRTIITIPVAAAAAGMTAHAALAFAAATPGPGVTPRSVPRTIARRRTLVGGRLRVAATPHRLTHLGITWQGGAATVTTTGPHGRTAWSLAHGCPGGRDGRTSGGHALLVTTGATGYEVVVSGAGARGGVTELNTIDGPAVAAAAEPRTGMLMPDGSTCPVTYLPRAAWGADEGLRYSGGTEVWPAEYAPTQTLTVHHTAGANNDPNPAATVRAIYFFQAVTQGWGDIGYHLLIDEQGRVYEGRFSGTDSVPAFASVVAARTSPALVTAAHIGGWNTGNAGVCLLGDLTGTGPTAAARATLVTVLASLARACRIDPDAVVTYVGPTGATRTVSGISGHRDWAATECPGNTFYPQLATIRGEVAALVGPVAPPAPVQYPRPAPTATRSSAPRRR